MIEFLSNYGIWILFGLMFLFMLRGHAKGGGGCCGGGHQHDGKPEEVTEQANPEQPAKEKSGPGCH